MDIQVKGKILQTFGARAIVQSEHKAETIRFVFSDPPEGGYDLSWSLMWVDEAENGDEAILSKSLVDGKLVLSWDPTRTQTQTKGKLTIQLKGVELQGTTEVRKWLSIVSYITIPSTMTPGTVEEIDPELFDYYHAKFQKLYDDSVAYINAAKATIPTLAETSIKTAFSSQFPSDQEVSAAIEEAWNG